jgi:hypothetical protein
VGRRGAGPKAEKVGRGGARVELGLRSVGKVLFFFKAFVSNLFKFFKL